MHLTLQTSVHLTLQTLVTHSLRSVHLTLQTSVTHSLRSVHLTLQTSVRSGKRPWAAEKRQATLGWAKQGSRVPVTNPRFARAWPIRKTDSARAAPRPLGQSQDLPRLACGLPQTL